MTVSAILKKIAVVLTVNTVPCACGGRVEIHPGWALPSYRCGTCQSPIDEDAFYDALSRHRKNRHSSRR